MLIEEIKQSALSPGRRDLRKFGITLGVVLLLLAGWFYWKQLAPAFYVGVISLAFLALALAAPNLLRPLYMIWMTFATVMGYFMSRLILLLLFSLVFVPAGIAIRLLKKDPLNEKLEPEKDSYWIRRQKEVYKPEFTERQF